MCTFTILDCQWLVCHIFIFSYQLAEQALKARKEIADYIKSGRIERARIRVSSCHCDVVVVDVIVI